MSKSNVFPIVTFLDVPRRTASKPLWMMMGTAFKISCAHHSHDPNSLYGGNRTHFLTAKHTFAPWQYTQDPESLKIPHKFRKLRFVTCRMYLPSTDGGACVNAYASVQLSSIHPTDDIAVLSISNTHLDAVHFCAAPALQLSYSTRDYEKGSRGTIVGYRGVGKLGELDTFSPSLLQSLPPEEQEALLKDLQDVEGKQELAQTDVEILDPKGMCHGVPPQASCYHGMSGAPLVTANGAVAGILSGKHPDFPENIAFVPASGVIDWLRALAGKGGLETQPSDGGLETVDASALQP